MVGIAIEPFPDPGQIDRHRTAGKQLAETTGDRALGLPEGRQVDGVIGGERLGAQLLSGEHPAETAVSAATIDSSASSSISAARSEKVVPRQIAVALIGRGGEHDTAARPPNRAGASTGSPRLRAIWSAVRKPMP
jgi:hypothetical protein